MPDNIPHPRLEPIITLTQKIKLFIQTHGATTFCIIPWDKTDLTAVCVCPFEEKITIFFSYSSFVCPWFFFFVQNHTQKSIEPNHWTVNWSVDHLVSGLTWKKFFSFNYFVYLIILPNQTHSNCSVPIVRAFSPTTFSTNWVKTKSNVDVAAKPLLKLVRNSVRKQLTALRLPQIQKR